MKKSMLTLFAFSALMMGTSIYSTSTASAPVIPTGGLSTTNSMSTDDMMHILPYPNENQDDGLESSLYKLDSDAQNALQKLHSEWQSLESDALKAFQQLQAEWKSSEADLRSHHMNRMHKDQDMIQDMMSKGGLRAVEDSKGNVIGAYKTLGETKGYRYGSFYTNLSQTPVSVIENGANLGTPVNIAVSGVSSTIIGYLDNPDYQGEKPGLVGGPVKQITLYQYTMPVQPVMDHAIPVVSTAIMPAPITKNVTVQSYNDNDKNDNNHKKHHNDNDHDDEHHHLISIF